MLSKKNKFIFNNKKLFSKKSKYLSPLIATILLVVVSVIIISILINWGSDFASKRLKETSTGFDLKKEDTFSSFQTYNHRPDGFVFKNLSSKSMDFTHYKIISEEDSEVSDVLLPFDSQITITAGGFVSIPILCAPSSSFKINLITSDGVNIIVPIKNVDYNLNSCDDIDLIFDEDDDLDGGDDGDNQDSENSVCFGSLENGSGDTEEDPIVICSVDDLNSVRNNLDKYYVLGLSLDLNISPYNEGTGWEPIGNLANKFVGGFDGNGNIISNLYIHNPAKNYAGLFGYIQNAEIKKLGLENVDINANNYVGSLAGYVYNSYVSESYSLGSVKSKGYLGGFVGFSSNSYIYNNFAVIDVFCAYSLGTNICPYVAGFISYDVNSSFINCYSASNVVGYTIGYPGEDAPAGAGPTAGFISSRMIGGGKGAVAAITANNYYDVNAAGSGLSTSSVAVGKTTQEMKNPITFNNWDFENIWYIEHLLTYPYLRAFNEELPEVVIEDPPEDPPSKSFT